MRPRTGFECWLRVFCFSSDYRVLPTTLTVFVSLLTKLGFLLLCTSWNRKSTWCPANAGVSANTLVFPSVNLTMTCGLFFFSWFAGLPPLSVFYDGGVSHRTPASRAMALNSIPLRGERSAKWYECLTLNADGRIWTHRPCSPWHISFQDCALITIWVRRHNGNALCKACLFLESTHRLYHSRNADSRTWTYTPSFDGYWLISNQLPYQLGLYLQNRRCRDHQITADTILTFYILL